MRSLLKPAELLNFAAGCRAGGNYAAQFSRIHSAKRTSRSCTVVHTAWSEALEGHAFTTPMLLSSEARPIPS